MLLIEGLEVDTGNTPSPDSDNRRAIPSARSHGIAAGYQLFVLALSIYAVGALLLQTTTRLHPEVGSILDRADTFICVVFFIDFLVSLWRAEDRWHYFRTWGWIDLLSSIPVLDSARWGRLARIVRILRILRGLRAARILGSLILRQRARNGLLSAALAGFFLILICSIAELIFEAGNGGPINSGEDALWWALTTVTTVGYGDFYPVTAEGRIVATVLMFGGVGLFGVFSGLLAAWFVAPQREKSEDSIEQLRLEIAGLKAAIEQLGRSHTAGESHDDKDGSA